MKETVTESAFVNAFDEANRANNFSRAARRAMFEYFEEYEEDCGVEMDFDVIAICCEWSHYDTLQECLDQYDNINTLEDLRDHTTVIKVTEWKVAPVEGVGFNVSTTLTEVDAGVVIQDF